MIEDKKEFAEIVEEAFKNLQEEIMTRDNEILVLQRKNAEAVKKMQDLAKYIEKVTGRKNGALDAVFKRGVRPVHALMSIGDAIEAIIFNEGAKTQKELIKKIKEKGVRISEKAPYVVIKNAILRDKRKRFVILKDSRIDLAENKKGNREIASKAKADVIRKRKVGV